MSQTWFNKIQYSGVQKYFVCLKDLKWDIWIFEINCLNLSSMLFLHPCSVAGQPRLGLLVEVSCGDMQDMGHHCTTVKHSQLTTVITLNIKKHNLHDLQKSFQDIFISYYYWESRIHLMILFFFIIEDSTS